MNNNQISPEEQINRYVYDVTRRLPSNQRSEIDKELHSLIEDMVTERCNGREPLLDDVNSVLLELGEPREFANKYREKKQYLIGPEYYEIYLLVLKIVMAAVLFGITIALVIKNAVNPPTNIFAMFGDFVAAIVSAVFQAFAWVTVIFAVINHYDDQNVKKQISKEYYENEKKWTPADLNEIPNKNIRIKKSECIVGIIFSIIFLMLINAAPQFLGAFFTDKGNTVVIPVFNMDKFYLFLPLFNISICIGLIKELLKLFSGKYSIKLSIGLLILSSVSVILTLLIFTNPDLWNSSFLTQISAISGLENMPKNLDFHFYANIATRVLVGIVLFSFVVDNISNFYKSIFYKSGFSGEKK